MKTATKQEKFQCVLRFYLNEATHKWDSKSA